MTTKLISQAFCFILCLFFLNNSMAQVNVTVTINSGTSGTTCTDGTFDSNPEEQWRVQIAGQGYTTYPENGICFNNTPNVQFSEFYNCATGMPSTLNICFRAFEDDGSTCIVSESCLEQVCADFAIPAVGTSANYTLSIPNDGFNTSWGMVDFTISVTGSFNGNGNDLICDAIDLGTLPSGGSVGDNNLSNYSNYCAANTGEPEPWGASSNDQGVWFTFTTSSEPGTVELSAANDPQALGDQIDLQLALYETSTGDCNGALTLVTSDYNSMLFDEDMQAMCLKPNTTYFILVDGEETSTNGGQEGYFGLEITDNGIVAGKDEICDAEDLGVVPTAGSVSTGTLSRHNSCATNTNDPNPVNWNVQKGVWFSFLAPASGGIYVEANSDLPFPSGTDAIDLQLALFESSDGTCNGVITEVSSYYESSSTNESFLRCLNPGDTYWILVDGSSANEEGIFDLMIKDSVETYPVITHTITACDSAIWVDGNTYYNSNNTASYAYTSIIGCDSIVDLDLTINYANASTDVYSLCNDSLVWVDGNTYTSNNNTATYLYTNAQGCDSTLYLDLTITNVEATISQSGENLSAEQNGLTYQWIDCDQGNTVIAGANDQNYTATENGDFAVIVTDNGCADTSACVTVTGLSTESFDQHFEYQIYPNPNNTGKFTVEIPAGMSYKAEVYTADGKLIQTELFNQAVNQLDLGGNKGVYILKLYHNGIVETQRLVIH